MRNPFTPNFGQVPMHIAGRELVIEDIRRSWEDGPGNPARTSIFVGARGTGKTALLSYFAEECRTQGWLSVNVTCIPGMQEDILQQIVLTAEALLPKEKKARLTGISVGQFFSAQWEHIEDKSKNWRMRITELLIGLEQFDVGLLITIDEITPQLDEMIQIASVYQLLLREKRKIALLMAGLPSEVSALLNDRSVSFLRRASQYELGRVEDYEIEDAFRKTTEESGKTITEEALQKAVQAIDGFPYMMQLVGYRAWQQAEEKKTIDMPAVKKGIAFANKDFENRVLKATVQALSDGDRNFLYAMLPDDGVSKISEIEKRIGQSSGYASRYRARLITQGVIEASGRGYVSFALPGLREYLASNL